MISLSHGKIIQRVFNVDISTTNTFTDECFSKAVDKNYNKMQSYYAE